jgi:predicted nucleic acid-binding Zn ribbon protein
MNMHSKLVASMANPEEARAWREAIRCRAFARNVGELVRALSTELVEISMRNLMLSSDVSHFLRREKRRRQRAAIADFVLGSLALIYVWAVVLLNLQ